MERQALRPASRPLTSAKRSLGEQAISLVSTIARMKTSQEMEADPVDAVETIDRLIREARELV
jgi:hypothetical protein